jgi:outer membrane lipoprotein-sorting protein
MIRRTVFYSLIAAVVAFALPAAAQDASEIVRSAWDNWRGQSSYGEFTMTIHRPSWERAMTMRSWTRGSKHSLVRVIEPRKDKGNGTLMVDNNMWSYSPKINRVIKVPSSMMGQNWMGSDFSNKDVSRADDIVDQYSHTLQATEEHEGHKVFVIEAIPHEDSAVVWGKEIIRVRDDNVLLAEEFYDQEGILVKTLNTLEVGEMGGRVLPIRQRMAKVDSDDEWTELRFDSVDFDVDLAESTFTRSNLQTPRE